MIVNYNFNENIGVRDKSLISLRNDKHVTVLSQDKNCKPYPNPFPLKKERACSPLLSKERRGWGLS